MDPKEEDQQWKVELHTIAWFGGKYAMLKI